MMSHAWAPSRLVVLAGALAIAAGCREGTSVSTPMQEPAPLAIATRVVVERSGSSALVTLVLDVPAAMDRVGSYTGRLAYDTTALHFVDETSLGDGALRASNAARGLVRVAGAAPGGITPARLTVLRFEVIDAKGLDGLRFGLDELHEVTRNNLLPQVRTVPGTPVAP